jgi:hypothetical protein
VPIPYPNTSKSDKTDQGTKTVKIGGDEVGQKNSSTYKESTGDEAATKSLGMGVVSHTIQGKLKFTAWSMDVNFEGKNIIRHMDMTTHNHINQPNIAMTLNAAGVGVDVPKDLNCKELEAKRDEVEKRDLQRFGRGRTLATGSYQDPAGDNILMKGVSHLKSMVKAGKRAGFAVGKKWPYTKRKPRKAKKGKYAKAYKGCQEKSKYDPQGMQHAEATMIEDILNAARQNGVAMPPGPVGSLTLSIKWKPSGTRLNRDDPCPSCEDLVCQAKECGLDIKICKDGKKTTPKC